MANIYVGDDGKLHKVQGGADTVLPFSSKLKQVECNNNVLTIEDISINASSFSLSTGTRGGEKYLNKDIFVPHCTIKKGSYINIPTTYKPGGKGTSSEIYMYVYSGTDIIKTLMAGGSGLSSNGNKTLNYTFDTDVEDCKISLRLYVDSNPDASYGASVSTTISNFLFLL